MITIFAQAFPRINKHPSLEFNAAVASSCFANHSKMSDCVNEYSLEQQNTTPDSPSIELFIVYH